MTYASVKEEAAEPSPAGPQVRSHVARSRKRSPSRSTVDVGIVGVPERGPTEEKCAGRLSPSGRTIRVGGAGSSSPRPAKLAAKCDTRTATDSRATGSTQPAPIAHTRPQNRRPRAAMHVATTYAAAAETGRGSVSPEDMLDDRGGAQSRTVADARDATANTPTDLEPRPASGPQLHTRARDAPDVDSAPGYGETSPKSTKRARIRPVARSGVSPPLLPASVSPRSEAEQTDRPRRNANPINSRPSERRTPWSASIPADPATRPTRARSKTGADDALDGRPSESPPGVKRDTEPAEATVIRIRTERCLGHAASSRLNAFDIIAGGTKKLTAQTR